MRPHRPAALLLALILAAAACGGSSPELYFDDAVPADLRELAARTWETFLEAIPGRTSCIPPLDLAGAREMDARAAYVPETATLVVRIPGTAGQLENVLVHEFAHHVEFSCPTQAELRPAFLAAQGFPPDAGWFDAETWEDTPSEQFAEAMVEAVLGSRLRNRNVLITDEAVAVVKSWGQGG